MDGRALLAQGLTASHQFVKFTVNDVEEGEAVRQPTPVLSPLVWQVGHLALTHLSFIQRAGAIPAAALPARYTDLFKPGTGGAADYPAFREVMTAFDETHEALMRTVAEANLEAPAESPRGLWSNVGELFAFANTHRWYHIGKIMSLRALLGKPRLLG